MMQTLAPGDGTVSPDQFVAVSQAPPPVADHVVAPLGHVAGLSVVEWAPNVREAEDLDGERGEARSRTSGRLDHRTNRVVGENPRALTPSRSWRSAVLSGSGGVRALN
jgi:hypothetical protein